MSTTMKKWIGETVIRELKLAIDWTNHEISVGNRAESIAADTVTRLIKQEEGTKKYPPSDRDYQNDGSNFIINLSCLSQAMPLQIVNFLDHSKEPLEAQVSDSECMVLARFSKDATTKFEKDNYKRFTDSTKGGIFYISRAQLITTRYGNSQNKVQLMIEDFRFRGSSGSNTFSSPEYLHQSKWKEPVKGLVKELFAALEEQAKAALEQTMGLDPLLETESSDQVEDRAPPVIASLSERDLTLNSQVPFLTQPLTPEPKLQSGAEERRKRSEKLLAMYQQGNPATNPIIRPERSPRMEQRHRTVAHVEAKGSRRSKSPSETVLSLLPPSNPVFADKTVTKRQTQAVEYVATGVHSRPQASSIKAGAVTSNVFHTGNFKLVKNLMNSGSIPKNQDDVLRRPSSWAHPAPGYRFPNANIPIDLLAEFNKLVETRRSEKQPGSQLRTDPLVNRRTDAADFTASFPVSSSRHASPSSSSISTDNPLPWSSSPPQQPSPFRLPPDSSALSPLSRHQTPTRVRSFVRKDLNAQQASTAPIPVMSSEASSEAELPRSSVLINLVSPQKAKFIPDRGLKYGKGVFGKTAIRSSIPFVAQPKTTETLPIASSPTSSHSTSSSSAQPTIIDVDQYQKDIDSHSHETSSKAVAANDLPSQDISSSMAHKSDISASPNMSLAGDHHWEEGSASTKRKRREFGVCSSAAESSKRQRTERDSPNITPSNLIQSIGSVKGRGASSSSRSRKHINISQNEAIVGSAFEGTRLIIGNLPYATTERELEELFKDYQATIVSIHVDPHVNPLTSRTVVYAFLDLSTLSEAERAVSELNGRTIFDCEVVVELFDASRNASAVLPDNQDKAVELGEEPQKKVVIQGVAGSKGFFIKNIPLTVTEEEVRGFLKDYLIETVSLPLDPGTNQQKGYAFVNAGSISEAARAVAGLNGIPFPVHNTSVPITRQHKEASTEDPAVTARRNRSEALAAIKNGTLVPSESDPSSIAHVACNIPLTRSYQGLLGAADVSSQGKKEGRDGLLGLQATSKFTPPAYQQDKNGSSGSQLASNPASPPNPPRNKEPHADRNNPTSEARLGVTANGKTPQIRPESFPKPNSRQVRANDSVQVERTPVQGHTSNRSFDMIGNRRVSVIDTSMVTAKSNQATPLIKSYKMAALGALPSAHSEGFEGLLRRFHEAYPNYGGDLKHFKSLCTRAQAAQHQFLWDDFVVRHKVDYVAYTAKCNEEGDDPTSYEKFYLDQIEDPKYSKRVLSKATLDAASSETRIADTYPSTANVGVSSVTHTKSNSRTATNTSTPTNLQEPPPIVDGWLEHRTNGLAGANSDKYQIREKTYPATKNGHSELDGIELPTKPLQGSRTLPWSSESRHRSDARGHKSTAEGNPNQTPVSSGPTDNMVHPSPQRERDSYIPSTAPTGPRSQINRFARASAPMQPHRRSGTSRTFSDRSYPSNSKLNPSNDQRQVHKLEPQTHASKVNKVTTRAGGEDDTIVSISPPILRRTASSSTAVAEVARPSRTTGVENVMKSIEQAPSQHNEWWRDEATPFKEYARQYTALKVLQTVGASPLTRSRPHIDVFAWKLP